jgi:Tfp pilus assembly protein PilV
MGAKKTDKPQRKIKNQSGETIAETLVALLISSIALMMLASMINSTVNLVTKSEAKMGDYYAKNAELENSAISQNTFIITIEPQNESESKLNMSVKGVHYQTNDLFSKTVVAYSYVSQEGSSTGGGGDNTDPAESGG